MKRYFRILLVFLFGIAVAAFIYFMYLINSFTDGWCGNHISKTINSPSHRYKAIVFQRDCGATTGFSSQLSVLPINEELKEKDGGNILTADSGNGKAKLDQNGLVYLNPIWKNDNTLLVQYDSLVSTYMMEDRYGEIKIEYKKVGNPKYPLLPE